MKTTIGIKDVFAAYGEAAYNTQLMEYDLVTIWMLDSVGQGVSVARQDLLRFQADWGKKTFGQLLEPLRKSNMISSEIKDFLEQLRNMRNRLMHHFFLDSAMNLQTNDGRRSVVAELQCMNKVIEKGYQFFEDILKIYLKDFDVDAEAIKEQILQREDGFEQNDELRVRAGDTK
jgi:hypothetical protein